ncbi:hypothetical protein M0R45_000639 [Rubus argutus]|uniref:Uncharacterized protein n=1 Tax=Rubus argutus TaxID=59490 RepID=A0AAW1VQ92_RUBAR
MHPIALSTHAVLHRSKSRHHIITTSKPPCICPPFTHQPKPAITNQNNRIQSSPTNTQSFHHQTVQSIATQHQGVPRTTSQQALHRPFSTKSESTMPAAHFNCSPPLHPFIIYGHPRLRLSLREPSSPHHDTAEPVLVCRRHHHHGPVPPSLQPCTSVACTPRTKAAAVIFLCQSHRSLPPHQQLKQPRPPTLQNEEEKARKIEERKEIKDEREEEDAAPKPQPSDRRRRSICREPSRTSPIRPLFPSLPLQDLSRSST